MGGVECQWFLAQTWKRQVLNFVPNWCKASLTISISSFNSDNSMRGIAWSSTLCLISFATNRLVNQCTSTSRQYECIVCGRPLVMGATPCHPCSWRVSCFGPNRDGHPPLSHQHNSKIGRGILVINVTSFSDFALISSHGVGSIGVALPLIRGAGASLTTPAPSHS